jgi:hypothetical protein
MCLRTNIVAAESPALSSLLNRSDANEERPFVGTRSRPPTNNSSITNGIARASAKGHPIIVPNAKEHVASNVRRTLFLDGSWNAYEHAKHVVYIANVEGRKAIVMSHPFPFFKHRWPTTRCIPHSSVENHHEQQVSPHSVVDMLCDCPVKFRFTEGRDEGEHATQ